MAKKASGGSGILILFVAVIAAFQFVYEWILNNKETALIAVLVIFSLIFLFWYKRYRDDKKWISYLKDKYKDDEVVERILKGRFWQGQTAGQLRDSLGSPDDVDKKVLKTKIKETWKFDEVRKGQYALKINIEDGVVVGWERRGR